MYIAIEGAVGCGKSTLLELLRQRYSHALFFKEPIEKFTQFQEYNPLFLAYTDPIENAGFSQLHIIDQSCAYYRAALDSIPDNHLVFSERCVISPVIFSHTLNMLGYMSDFALDYALSHWKEQSRGILIPDYVIFLDVDPAICQDRVLQRGRIEEMSSTMPKLMYQKYLRESYLNYFCDFLPDTTRFKAFAFSPNDSVESVLDHVSSFLDTTVLF